MAVEVGAEDPELRRLGHVLLPAGEGHQLFAHRGIGDADNGAALQEAGAGGTLRTGKNGLTLGIADGLIGKMANGTVGTKQINYGRHAVSLYGR